jgi:colanic acid biosynthesis glycosyl transferase WcaI
MAAGAEIVRVLLLNQAYAPDHAATAQHAHDLARHLVAHGHAVTAVASRSLYGERGAALPRRETIEGVQVERVGSSLFGKAGLLARAVDFAIFWAAAAWRVLRLPRQDAIVCLTTPPFIVLVGLLSRAIKGGRVVLWSMDLYPDAPVAFGAMRASHPLAAVAAAIDRFCLRRTDAVVALGRCMRERLLAKGAPADRLHTIGVWSDEEEVAPGPREGNRYREEWGIGDRMLVMYSGNFGLGHDVETFLGAAGLLRQEDRIRFAFVGGGKRKPEVEARVRGEGLSNCVLAPYQPRERLGELLGAADLHLVTLRPGVEGIMVPSKFYGIMASGRPAILVGGAEGEIALTIAEERCGAVVAAGDAAGLAAALRERLDHPRLREEEGRRGREALRLRHARRIRCEAWRRLLESLAEAPA